VAEIPITLARWIIWRRDMPFAATSLNSLSIFSD
jgi:hypothetical protein